LRAQVAFACGAFIPLIPLLIPSLSHTVRIVGVVIAVTIGLVVLGLSGAAAGGASLLRPTARVLLFGWFAMAVTYGIGRALGTSAA